MENATPMLRQYLEIKRLYPGTLLFFRLGDFYELFNEDAVTGARELQITLTARHKDSANPIPMCGVPHHAAATYIARLVKKGYRVAICEQAEAATKGTKLVKREVVRVITPGTAVDPQLLDAADSVYLAAVAGDGESYGAAFLDVSTGQLSATQITGNGSWQAVSECIASFGPKEIVCSEQAAAAVEREFGLKGHSVVLPGLGDEGSTNAATSAVTVRSVDFFDPGNAEEALQSHFGVKSLDGFGIGGRREAIRAAAAALRYAKETQKASAAHVTEIKYFEPSDSMVLDAVTLRNLEIVDTRSEGGRALCNVLNETITSMGTRLLKSWLVRPSIKRTEIQTRLAAVTELADAMTRDTIRYHLKEVADLERLVGRVNLGTATARDLVALNRSLSCVPEINASLSDAASLLLQVLNENIFPLPELTELIERGIANDAPVNLSDGGTIRDGFNAELDDLRTISRTAKQTIAGFEEHEKTRTGISSLKVRFNSVFGYYIEVSKANSSRAPEDYERRQTLANAERFTTPQLKEWEAKVLGAEEKILALEAELFDQIRSAVRAETHKLQSTARALATLDVLASLAETAARRNYVAPVLHDGDEIEIKGGRHPVVEASLRDSFVPNDVYLNNSTDRLLIVTGANMGGKSTILRQIALIQIMAQIGSFVPASFARLPVIDRVWTRVGASDDLASGRSTFMVEMTETAAILNSATPRSLVLLDEIGRGTSTFDGLSIAWAVAEYLHNSPEHSAKTLFATHYHELTELAENLPGAKNYQLTATERNGEVVFLHKLQKGKASKSYGIAVARLAGLPGSVIERAKDVLARLERYELAVFADDKKTGLSAAAAAKAASQVSLFAITNENAIEDLRTTDVDNLSPEQSKDLLREIKRKIV
ncbi:MAG TPA: DNA mismatch repair protein MutS [Pyrinomonadaceae bacterium]|nr:DNA mismatch repair protein MutS [Pyrinomonadaceae bacterium]